MGAGKPRILAAGLRWFAGGQPMERAALAHDKAAPHLEADGVPACAAGGDLRLQLGQLRGAGHAGVRTGQPMAQRIALTGGRQRLQIGQARRHAAGSQIGGRHFVQNELRLRRMLGAARKGGAVRGEHGRQRGRSQWRKAAPGTANKGRW